ncbi:hypothetical protein R1sor_014729 [Riccia sorocarpa]|uniref:Uncharacterized protein n=1 Tax=Riccia sorocarpa TaxID=122646 RepID=A0ABD3HDE4_9MARC
MTSMALQVDRRLQRVSSRIAVGGCVWSAFQSELRRSGSGHSSFANTNARRMCCQLLERLHDPEYGHVQCYCQLAPTGTGLFADIAAKCDLQRNLQTCHG